MKRRFATLGLLCGLSTALGVAGCDFRRGDAGDTGAADAAAPAVKSEAMQVVSQLRARFGETAAPRPHTLLPSPLAAAPTPLATGLANRFAVGRADLRPVFAEPAIGSPPARRAELSLPASASGAFTLRDPESGMSIAVALEGATDAAADAAGGFVVYRGALDGADLIHRPTPEGTEDNLAFEHAPGRPEVTYRVSLTEGVAGLRMVSDAVEFVDVEGGPRLRMAPPVVIGADRKRTQASVSIEGCAADHNPAAPWGRAPVLPGATSCIVRIAWSERAVAFPALLDPAWTTVGSMAIARANHSLTSLGNGLAVAAGGYTGNATELFNAKTNTWANTGPITWNRANHVAVLLNNGKVLIAGGSGSAGSSAELYDPGLGTWKVTKGSMSDARIDAAGTLLLDGRVMICCGVNNQSFSTSSVDIYDPTTDVFTSGGNVAISRYGHAMLTLPSGKVLVVGGATGGARWTEGWDPLTSMWTHVSTRPLGRSNVIALTR